MVCLGKKFRWDGEETQLLKIGIDTKGLGEWRFQGKGTIGWVLGGCLTAWH